MDNNFDSNMNNVYPNGGETTVLNQQPMYQEPAYRPVPQQPVYQAPVAEPAAPVSNAKAIISLILGILSVTCCCGGIVPSVVAIILAGSDKKARGGKRSGMATAGMIMGIIGLVIGIPVLAYNLFAIIGGAGMGFLDILLTQSY